jgi:hypothetical protein
VLPTTLPATEVKTLQKLLRLSAREFWVLVQAAVLLPAVRCALKFVTIARLQLIGARTVNDSRRGSPAPKQTKQQQPTAAGTNVNLALSTGPSLQSIARMVRVAAEHGPFRAKCLEQSLVLRWLLLRRGFDARILFGARKEDEQMQAHAWVEVDGVALNEDGGVYRGFSPLDEILAGN